MAALVDAGGTVEVGALMKQAGVPRLAAKSTLRDLERRHGWLRVNGKQARLTQPYIGAIDRTLE